MGNQDKDGLEKENLKPRIIGRPTNLDIGKDSDITLENELRKTFQDTEKPPTEVVIKPTKAEYSAGTSPFVPDKQPTPSEQVTINKELQSAGIQDMTQVHPMYKNQVEAIKEKKKEPESVPSTSQGQDQNDIIEDKLKGEDPKFKLGVHRENMNKGGWFVPNESKPYRPG